MNRLYLIKDIYIYSAYKKEKINLLLFNSKNLV